MRHAATPDRGAASVTCRQLRRCCTLKNQCVAAYRHLQSRFSGAAGARRGEVPHAPHRRERKRRGRRPAHAQLMCPPARVRGTVAMPTARPRPSTTMRHATSRRAVGVQRCAPVITTVVLVVACVLLLRAAPATAELVAGCTVNDVTRILESCPASTVSIAGRGRNIHGIAEDAFPPGSQLVAVCVL